MHADTATYVYCLVGGDRPPSGGDVPQGLSEMQPARLLEIEPRLFAVVADAPLERYSAEAIAEGLADIDWVSARAVEHEAVVEYFLTAGTVVPMKLFTLFSSDDRALADLRGRSAAIRDVLRTIERRREWGVRVLRGRRPSPAVGAADATAPTSGTAFLVRKKRERDELREAATRARERGDAVFAELLAFADDARRREPAAGEPTSKVVLDAAFLVAESETAGFREALERARAALAREGLEVALTGPWPAYHFVEETP